MSVAAAPSVEEIIQSRTRIGQIWTIIRRDPLVLTSLTVVFLFVLMALLAPWVAPYPEQGAGKTNASTVL
jgi:ABC-type antimicrobial peptide transport system permease subunit